MAQEGAPWIDAAECDGRSTGMGGTFSELDGTGCVASYPGGGAVGAASLMNYSRRSREKLHRSADGPGFSRVPTLILILLGAVTAGLVGRRLRLFETVILSSQFVCVRSIQGSRFKVVSLSSTRRSFIDRIAEDATGSTPMGTKLSTNYFKSR